MREEKRAECCYIHYTTLSLLCYAILTLKFTVRRIYVSETGFKDAFHVDWETRLRKVFINKFIRAA